MIADRLKSFLQNNGRSREDIRQFLEFGIGYALVMVIGFFLVRMLNQNLTPEEMGKYSFVNSLVQIIAPLLCFNASQAYLRFHDNHSISMHLRRFLYPFFIGAAVILCGVVYYCTHSILALVFASFPFFMEKTYFLRVQMEITKLNILRILELLLPLAGVFAVIHFLGKLDADIVLLLYGIGFLSSFLFHSKKMNTLPICKKDILNYLWPTIFISLFTLFLNNSAVIFAKMFLGLEAAGFMGVAVKSLLFIQSLYTVFLMFYPMIYIREAKSGNLKLIRIYRIVLLAVSGSVCVLFMIFHQFFYRLLGASQYLEHSDLFVWLLLLSFLNFICDICWLYYSFEIKTWKSALLKLLSIVILLPLLLLWGKENMNCIVYSLIIATGVSTILGTYLALRGERKIRMTQEQKGGI